MGDRPIVADLASNPFPGLSVRGDRPRVAIISLHTSPTAALGHSANGGLNVYVREICRAFSDRGIATDVFTRVPRGTSLALEQLAASSRVIPIPAGPDSLTKYELAAEVDAFANGVLDFAARRGLDYQLVYSHYWLSGAAAGILSEAWCAPWAHTAHTLAVVKNRSLAPGDQPEPAARERIEAEVARAADLLVVSTAAEGQDLEQLYGVDPGRVAVVPPGVDITRFRPTSRAAARRRLEIECLRPVLFVGRLERLKGAEIALRAFASAAAGHPDACLLVLGGDSFPTGDGVHGVESECERLAGVAAELGISDRVRFAGSVAHQQLPLYYAASEALLMPSYSESFGLVGLEAQACGCPVIAADLAGLASVVRDGVTGYLVSGHDPADYADRLARLLADPELSAQLGRRGTLLAQRFSWERTGDRLVRVFEPLLASSQDRVQVSARHE
jgi:D-inositol-3-phosphate glycosyltransferase